MRLLLIESHRPVIAQVQSIVPFVFTFDTVSPYADLEKTIRQKKYDAIVICREELFSRVRELSGALPVVFVPFLESAQDMNTQQRKSLHFGSLTLFVHQKTVHSGRKLLTLRKKEYLLLQSFLQFPQTTLQYTFLLQQAWDSWHRPSAATLQKHISNLRKELRRSQAQVTIKTLHGVGYRLETL
jgi:DNA-binding response OmpR family regulator